MYGFWAVNQAFRHDDTDFHIQCNLNITNSWGHCYKESLLYQTVINLKCMLRMIMSMVGAGNFGRKLQATILDAPYKYMY